jgi:hypothetical protein
MKFITQINEVLATFPNIEKKYSFDMTGDIHHR